MIVIWSLALLGILFKLTIAHRFKILSLVTYLTMGWLSLIVVYQLAVKLAAGGVTLLAVGGVVYSLGVIFYVCKRIPYNHAIWHGFVLGGSVCHFPGDSSVRGATRIDSVQPGGGVNASPGLYFVGRTRQCRNPAACAELPNGAALIRPTNYSSSNEYGSGTIRSVLRRHGRGTRCRPPCRYSSQPAPVPDHRPVVLRQVRYQYDASSRPF